MLEQHLIIKIIIIGCGIGNMKYVKHSICFIYVIIFVILYFAIVDINWCFLV